MSYLAALEKALVRERDLQRARARNLKRAFEVEALEPDTFSGDDDDQDAFFEMMPERAVAHLDV